MTRRISQSMRALCTVAALGALLLLTFGAPAAHAKTCKSAVAVPAALIFPNQSVAFADAVARWGIKAVATHGPGYNNWDNAENKNISCATATNGFGVNGRRCGVGGRPCKF